MIARRKYFGTKVKSGLNEFEKTSIKELKTRFSFWHNKQLDLLTFSINLIFTVSIALAGFIVNNNDSSLFSNKLLCFQFSLTKTSLFILSLSATLGIFGLITRLNDFKLTKDLVRSRQRIFELKEDIRYEAYEPSDIEYQKYKRDKLIWWTNFLGRMTWYFFYLQLSLFLTAIWMIVINI